MKVLAMGIAVALTTIGSLSVEAATKDAEKIADVFCQLKYEKFRAGSSLYTDSGIDVELNEVPEKYKKRKITKSAYHSEEPIKFKVKEAGIVLIAVHESAVEKYTSNGWSKKEQFECIDNNARVDSKSQKRHFVLLGKYHDVGEYEMKAELPFGLHLVL